MSKIKNGGLDQYGAEPFEQQQFGTAGVEGINAIIVQVNCLQQSEPGVVLFKLDCGLQFRVSINPGTMQSLRLKVASLQSTGIGSDIRAGGLLYF